ncbi:MAG: hypothetical protein JSS86_24955 [Cyanobacteria bacterium SZAS LIN-2]|nr:hypothetical protein [Cyanobacteria bacterium SZAS LIN-2]
MRRSSLPGFCFIASVIFSLGVTLQACSSVPDNDPDSRVVSEFSMHTNQVEFTKVLTSLREQPLQSLPDSSRSSVYRFVWLRTFHNWISIRVEHNQDGTTRVYAKELDRRGNAQIKPLLVDRELEWSDEQYNRFVDKVQVMQFWTTPSVLTITIRDLYTDGAQWILEGAERGRFHFVERGPATLPRNHALKELGLFLLKETNTLPSENQIY